MIRSAWKTFCKNLLVFNWSVIFIYVERQNIYTSCVVSGLIYGGKFWPMIVEHKIKLNRTEIQNENGQMNLL